MSEPIRIIAWGNWGRRDDGVGLHVAELLQEQLKEAGSGIGHRVSGIGSTADDRPRNPKPETRDPLPVVIQQYHQLGPELVPDLASCRLAIFIDADMRPGTEPVSIEPVLPAESPGLDTHHCRPAELLALARSVGLPIPPAVQIGVRAYDIDFGDELSPAAHEGMLKAVAEVLRLVREAAEQPEDACLPGATPAPHRWERRDA